MRCDRRWLAWLRVWCLTSTAFWFLQSSVALADNCSGASDCLESDKVAILVGLGAFLLALLDIGWHLIPGTGLLDSLIGFNLVTLEPLSAGDRFLGLALSPLDALGPGAPREIGWAMNAQSVGSSATEGDHYRQLAFDRMVMFHILTPDGHLLNDPFSGPGGSSDAGAADHFGSTAGQQTLGSNSGGGGNGTITIHTGQGQTDVVVINTQGPIQQGDAIHIDFGTAGSGTGGAGTP